MKKIFIGCIVAVMFLGCQSREDLTKNYADEVKVSTSKTISLPKNVSYSKKRGFNDFNGDGIEDMIEINDEAWFGQDFQVRIYEGYVNKEKNLAFSNKFIKVPLNIKVSWGVSNLKIDSADINGDGLSDIIFTEYKENWKTDDIKISVALNQGNYTFSSQLLEFTYYTSEYSNFMLFFNSVLTAYDYSYGEDESLYDYLKMDWGDVDGDGKDDLIMLWRSGRYDLDVEVLYTKFKDNSVSFYDESSNTIHNIMKNRNARNIDTADYDGDKHIDVVVYEKVRNGINISVALNKKGRFVPNKDVRLSLPRSLDIFSSAQKFDTFDVNMDEKSDFVYISEEDDKPVMVYFKSMI